MTPICTEICEREALLNTCQDQAKVIGDQTKELIHLDLDIDDAKAEIRALKECVRDLAEEVHVENRVYKKHAALIKALEE